MEPNENIQKPSLTRRQTSHSGQASKSFKANLTTKFRTDTFLFLGNPDVPHVHVKILTDLTCTCWETNDTSSDILSRSLFTVVWNSFGCIQQSKLCCPQTRPKVWKWTTLIWKLGMALAKSRPTDPLRDHHPRQHFCTDNFLVEFASETAEEPGVICDSSILSL